jgi:hypothetical protein
MLVGRVIDDEVDNYADAALLRAVGEVNEVTERSKRRVDGVIIGNVVIVVFAR